MTDEERIEKLEREVALLKRTLEMMGYKDKGGEVMQPPLGPNPFE